jgi:hypothetical protein
MRWLALPLQVIIPRTIGFYLAFAMALGMPATTVRNEIPPMIIFGGASIGVLAWFFGLLADRPSLIRLALTVALSILGLTVSYLLVEAVVLAPLWAPRSWAARDSPVVLVVLVYAAFATPLGGAMAGYYWPRREPGVQER